VAGKVSILGAGESGTGAAVLAAKKGFEVFVSDPLKVRAFRITSILSPGPKKEAYR